MGGDIAAQHGETRIQCTFANRGGGPRSDSEHRDGRLPRVTSSRVGRIRRRASGHWSRGAGTGQDHVIVDAGSGVARRPANYLRYVRGTLTAHFTTKRHDNR